MSYLFTCEKNSLYSWYDGPTTPSLTLGGCAILRSAPLPAPPAVLSHWLGTASDKEFWLWRDRLGFWNLRQTFRTELDLDSAHSFAKIRPMLGISLHPNAMTGEVCLVTSGGRPVHRCTCAPDGHLQVWWYQRLYSTILASWRWALVLETCRSMKQTHYKI